MKRMTAAMISGALIFSLTGCMYHIKLDPNDDSARVSINGEPKGRGLVEHKVDAKYGYPGDFGVKVEPQKGAAYTVEIKRELDVPTAVIQTTVSAGLGLAYLAGDLYAGRFPVGSLIILAYAPLSWLNSYYYKEYYDLSKIKRKEARDE